MIDLDEDSWLINDTEWMIYKSDYVPGKINLLWNLWDWSVQDYRYDVYGVCDLLSTEMMI